MVAATKQDTLREGIYALFSGCFTNMTGKIPNEEERGWLSAYTEQAQLYLHDNDVVRKVKRKLPVYTPRGKSDNSTNLVRLGFAMARRDMLKAGYTATEPLI